MYSKIKFSSLKLTVTNLQESIEFYEKLGFEVLESQNSSTSSSATLGLSGKQDFKVKLETFHEESFASTEKFSIEFEEMSPEEMPFEELIDYFFNQGLRYENIPEAEIGKIVYGEAIMKDPEGNIVTLVDNFTYED